MTDPTKEALGAALSAFSSDEPTDSERALAAAWFDGSLRDVATKMLVQHRLQLGKSWVAVCGPLFERLFERVSDMQAKTTELLDLIKAKP